MRASPVPRIEHVMSRRVIPCLLRSLALQHINVGTHIANIRTGYCGGRRSTIHSEAARHCRCISVVYYISGARLGAYGHMSSRRHRIPPRSTPHAHLGPQGVPGIGRLPNPDSRIYHDEAAAASEAVAHGYASPRVGDGAYTAAAAVAHPASPPAVRGRAPPPRDGAGGHALAGDLVASRPVSPLADGLPLHGGASQGGRLHYSSGGSDAEATQSGGAGRRSSTKPRPYPVAPRAPSIAIHGAAPLSQHAAPHTSTVPSPYAPRLAAIGVDGAVDVATERPTLVGATARRSVAGDSVAADKWPLRRPPMLHSQSQSQLQGLHAIDGGDAGDAVPLLPMLGGGSSSIAAAAVARSKGGLRGNGMTSIVTLASSAAVSDHPATVHSSKGASTADAEAGSTLQSASVPMLPTVAAAAGAGSQRTSQSAPQPRPNPPSPLGSTKRSAATSGSSGSQLASQGLLTTWLTGVGGAPTGATSWTASAASMTLNSRGGGGRSSQQSRPDARDGDAGKPPKRPRPAVGSSQLGTR